VEVEWARCGFCIILCDELSVFDRDEKIQHDAAC